MTTQEDEYRHAAERAIANFHQQLQQNPLNADVHNSMGNALFALGRVSEAIASYTRAAQIKPDFPDAHVNLAIILHSQGEFLLAENQARQAIRLKPDDPALHNMLAGILAGLARYGEALECFQTALHLQPDYIYAITGMADALEKTGEYEEAHKLISPLLSQADYNLHALLVYARLSVPLEKQKKAIALLGASRKNMAESDAVQIHAALGRLYDQVQQFDKAFRHYQQSNALKHSDFDPEKHAAFVQDIISAFSSANIRKMPAATNQSSLPIFIVGMPRSGTTLVEQILASHPDVFGAEASVAVEPGKGALDTTTPFPYYANSMKKEALNNVAAHLLEQMHQLAPNSTRICCNERRSFLYLGLIDRLFPGARIIHCVRNPIDTCLSCYFQSLAPAYSYSYDLDHLGKYYNQYMKLMNHWGNVLRIPIMEIRYEDMVTDQQQMTQRLLKFCKLDWNGRCLDFYEQTRGVSTPSYWQVRQPMYKTSVGRWKNYQKHLAPLINALD